MWAFLAALLLGLATSQAQTYLLDFGGANTTTRGPAPGDPLNYWNNVTGDVGGSSTGVLTNLVATDNTRSAINLVMVSRFNGINENGTVDSTIFPVNATRDSMFGNTELFGELADVYPSFKLTGLDATTLYSFTFYASRNGVGDVRETAYTVIGDSAQLAVLDPANNIDTTTSVNGLKPGPNGEIAISLAPTDNNNNGNHFTYLGVLRIDAVPPQTPLTFTSQPASQTVVAFQPATFSAAVQGPPPYSIQWFNNGTAIPDATQFTYTIPSVTADLDGAKFSVTVSNLAFGVTSTNAVLKVQTDVTAPTIVSAKVGGRVVEILFSEALDPASAADPANYVVNNGQATVVTAELRADTKTVAVTFAERATGTVTVKVSQVRDLAGNAIAAGASVSATAPASDAKSFLLDFGGGGMITENAPAPDDPANVWNNITETIGTSEFGELPGLVTGDGTTTDVGLVIIRPFNGANLNGTLVSGLFAADATSDSLYGNTEVFNGKTDIFPSFKLTALDPARTYKFTLYASRTGVGDNRETRYTLVGATTAVANLNVANNVTNVAIVSGIAPDAAGEISISLEPSPNNNNGNHFTYLGVLKLEQEPPRQPVVFTQQPASQNVSEGQPATFTAAVTGSQPYFITWSSNGVAIPGATQLTYTIPAATTGMNGAQYSVTVSNQVASVTSSNAVLTVTADTLAPRLLSATSTNGIVYLLTFSEPLQAAGANTVTNYSVENFGVDGAPVPIVSAQLQPDGRTVVLTLTKARGGSVSVKAFSVQDLAGNVTRESSLFTEITIPDPDTLLFDFGATTTPTLHGPAPGDPLNYWNNITAEIGISDTGELRNLVASDNTPTTVSLLMVNRFNGSNEAGTTGSALYPVNATRDSLFGNTEVFGGLTNIFPKFKLTGLDPGRPYVFTFFASRTGVADVRQTVYTLSGTTEMTAEFSASNATNTIVTKAGIIATAAGEITVSLTPGPQNNNANHFTYLGVMKVTAAKAVTAQSKFLPPVIIADKITLSWTGTGVLEAATSVSGPWSAVTGTPASPYTEVLGNGNRFFRLKP